MYYKDNRDYKSNDELEQNNENDTDESSVKNKIKCSNLSTPLKSSSIYNSINIPLKEEVNKLVKL